MKKLGIVALAACFALILSGCSGPKEKIIGKWEYSKKESGGEAKMTLDFQKDGKVKMNMLVTAGETKIVEESGEGTYKWTDNEHIEITSKDKAGKEETTKFAVKKVDDKELVLSGKMGASDKEEELKFAKK